MPAPKNPKDDTLRSIREDAGLTQKELGQLLITDNSNISYRETRWFVEDHSVRFLRDYVQACGGTVKVIIEINGQIKEI